MINLANQHTSIYQMSLNFDSLVRGKPLSLKQPYCLKIGPFVSCEFCYERKILLSHLKGGFCKPIDFYSYASAGSIGEANLLIASMFVIENGGVLKAWCLQGVLIDGDKTFS